jgi:hypothetical protein
VKDIPNASFDQDTPLWFYILREAHVRGGGGIGLLEGDRISFLRADPQWTPTLGKAGKFTMVDLLRVAGVLAAV